MPLFRPMFHRVHNECLRSGRSGSDSASAVLGPPASKSAKRLRSGNGHFTYETNELTIRGSTAIGPPLSSKGGPISKTCRTDAMLMKSDASAKCLPGQMLMIM